MGLQYKTNLDAAGRECLERVALYKDREELVKGGVVHGNRDSLVAVEDKKQLAV